MTTTPYWEDHYSGDGHRASVCQWRKSHELYLEASNNDETATEQSTLDAYDGLVVGAEKCVEISQLTDENQRKAVWWVCTLCVKPFERFADCLLHLGDFSHINRYMVRRYPLLLIYEITLSFCFAAFTCYLML